ncbi:AsmA family protein [Serratia plymuthica]|uniref:AsmA family protein n=1 Tax=Serratia plymuthica TaxID=82996 RepID=UPI0018D75574|nr:AsmA family protein [Serratia plymuthica]QPS56172.1 AsmA family protein [Serratia plymuthica]CAI2015546.1 putative assembly protein [Serratia plymuthica]
MTRTGKAFSWVGGIVLLVIAALVIFVMTFDWNRLKPTINDKVSAELQRPFAIRGELGVDWAREKDEGGWRAWVPWPHIHAEDIVLGNPKNIPGDSMVQLQRVDASIAPLALLGKEVLIPRIWLKQPNATLQRLANGDNNWTFNLAGDPKQPTSDWSVNIHDVVFDRGQIDVKDATLKADFRALIDPLGKPLPFSEVTGKKDAGSAITPDYVFGWKVKGKYNGEPLSGSGKMGGMLSLQNAEVPFPLQADVRSGAARVVVVGTLSDPMNLGGLDLRVKLSGDSLGNLYGLTGVLLPNTPPYSTDGHLIARLHEKGGAVFQYQKFDGKIGDSDIHGNLKYVASKPRPKLSGEVLSKQLRLADLAPLIGADSNTEKAGRGEKSRQPADKVLPVEKFDTKSWNLMDADVKFTAKRIERGNSLPLSDLSTHLQLDNGVILMDPLRFGVAGGNLNATLRLDGGKNPMQGRVDMHARKFQLQQLLPNVASMKRSLGQMNGDAKLTGSGNSVADLLATSSGELRMVVNNGVISRGLMEILGLNVGNYLVAKLFGDDVVGINCAAADVGIRNGVAAPRLFVFDTENAIINISGNTNLATERLDLSIDPESKGMRVLTLRSPLYVKGTFKNPDAGVKAGPLIARGAAAVALGVVLTPAAALLALVSPSEGGDENQCGQILQKMKQKK